MTIKICSRCMQAKDREKDFYVCVDKIRSECKACTIRKAIRYQKKLRKWNPKGQQSRELRAYMINYYSKNKEKFAEYRRKFKVKYPGYYKKYNKKKMDSAHLLTEPKEAHSMN